MKKDRVTRGRVDSEQVNCGGRQNNRGTGVKTYDIWDEKGLKKARV